MKLFNNLNETIVRRKSVRNFIQDQEIDNKNLTELKNFIEKFNTKSFRFEINDSFNASGEKLKLGTYGMIKGAKAYLIGIMNSTKKEDVINFGRNFEYIILKATELGIGTCWIVGTFDLKAFTKSVKLNQDEKVVMVGHNLNMTHFAMHFCIV